MSSIKYDITIFIYTPCMRHHCPHMKHTSNHLLYRLSSYFIVCCGANAHPHSHKAYSRMILTNKHKQNTIKPTGCL